MVTDTINLYPGHHSITGTVYWDLNGNGLIDSTDIGLNGQQILLTPLISKTLPAAGNKQYVIIFIVCPVTKFAKIYVIV